MIRLSVVVPFFNVQDYAGAALRSLQTNADPEIEFVLVDDGSTDATPQILAEHRDLRNATVITQPGNTGLCAARNAGLAAASGRYLSFLDGDDLVAPGHYRQLLAAIEDLRCDFVRTDHVQVRGRTRVVHHLPFAPRGRVVPATAGIGPPGRRSSVDSPHAWAGIYDRRLLEEGLLWFDEDLRTCEDRPWLWRLHLWSRNVAAVGLRGVRYRRAVESSLTQVCDERQLDFVPAFERILADVERHPQAAVHLRKALRSYCAIICWHLEQAERYPPALAAELRWRVHRSLARLPAAALDQTLALLDLERSRKVGSLRAAA